MSLSHPGRISDYGYSSTSGGVRRAQAQTFGIYLSDLIELTPQWKILLGAREDWFFNETQTWNKETVQKADEARFSSRAGLVWQPVDATSLYFSYGKSYIPNINHSSSNTIYDAEKGEQFEVGIKQDLIKDRLSANLAVYDLTREGVLVSDPTDPENLIQTGERRSRGIELDLAGEIAPGWKMIASYAYTDTEVVSDTVLPVGQPLSNVPLHSGSIWTTYQIQSGALKGFGLGAGLYYTATGRRICPTPMNCPPTGAPMPRCSTSGTTGSSRSTS
ncbi:TonB-dependent siderophore receptor [Verrucomicrobium spinosum]|uniref:TonB-dependent siderophore receptor n=1 Tax=Verrucomicrobium spinosum TaxID=2736 RepID=UPI00094656C2|nr:TonB-dependent receptor [Verrucomicrobium spinosum]